MTLTPPATLNQELWLKNAKEWSELDLRETLKKNIACPVLILAGEEDPNHPLSCAIETAACIPKKYLSFDPIPGAGTPVYQDQPAAFRKQVIRFLKALESAHSQYSL